MRAGALLGVIFDIYSVRTNPKVNLVGLGAHHDPGGGMNTSFLFNFDKKNWIRAAKKNLSEILSPVKSVAKVKELL